MKAMILEKPGPVHTNPLRPADLPLPEIGPGRIGVRVHACGVCHTDLHIVEGELVPPRLPLIPGHQVTGVVERLGPGAHRFKINDRVGLAWLHQSCGQCAFCLQDQENLCDASRFTGFHVPGGFAEYVSAHEEFVFPIPDVFSLKEAAPLLCAGIIGYRSLVLSQAKPGCNLGLYGFGAAAHIVIQIAVSQGMRVHVFSRGKSHLELASELGAVWTGAPGDTPPEKLHSSIIFAPAGPITLEALKWLEKGGVCALGGIYMSPIPELDYAKHLYQEKVLRSVTASTREDGINLLKIAAKIPVRTRTQLFDLEEANLALTLLKEGKINGEAVLRISKD